MKTIDALKPVNSFRTVPENNNGKMVKKIFDPADFHYCISCGSSKDEVPVLETGYCIHCQQLRQN